MQKPACLRQGDTVRIIAPASPFSRQKFMAGVTILRELGLKPVWRDDIFSSSDYLAGDDSRRAGELIQAFRDPDIAAVFPARGGFGCARTCHAVGSGVEFPPKLLVGFSDVSALHAFFLMKGLVTIHGPNVTTLPSMEPDTLEQYRRTIFGLDRGRDQVWEGLRCIRPGMASGSVLVANLTVLMSLAGTSLMPGLEGRILVLEDLNEKPYRLDRMLFQLSLQPGFQRVSAVVFGDFMLQGDDIPLFERTVDGFSARWGVPVVTGFPIGHGLANDCIGEGVDAEIDAARGRLSAQSPVSL